MFIKQLEGACMHVKFAYTSNPIDLNESIHVMKTSSMQERLEDGAPRTTVIFGRIQRVVIGT